MRGAIQDLVVVRFHPDANTFARKTRHRLPLSLLDARCPSCRKV
jgi:hypothetical protein